MEVKIAESCRPKSEGCQEPPLHDIRLSNKNFVETAVCGNLKVRVSIGGIVEWNVKANCRQQPAALPVIEPLQ